MVRVTVIVWLSLCVSGVWLYNSNCVALAMPVWSVWGVCGCLLGLSLCGWRHGYHSEGACVWLCCCDCCHCDCVAVLLSVWLCAYDCHCVFLLLMRGGPILLFRRVAVIMRLACVARRANPCHDAYMCPCVAMWPSLWMTSSPMSVNVGERLLMCVAVTEYLVIGGVTL